MSYTAEQQAAHRKLWAEALKSGRFKQTTGNLRNSNGYCCLGVACELAIENGVDIHIDDTGSGYRRYDGHTAVCPLQVMHWLGLRDEAGSFVDATLGISLVQANDTGASFDTIAKLIEDGKVKTGEPYERS